MSLMEGPEPVLGLLAVVQQQSSMSSSSSANSDVCHYHTVPSYG